jgi:hypothetical protein
MKNFVWKCKEIRISKIILKMNKAKELHYLVLKFIVSLQQLRQKDRSMEQNGGPRNSSYKYSNWI